MSLLPPAARRRSWDHRGVEEAGAPRRGLLPFGLVRVRGASMVPRYYDNDLLLVRYGARIRPGDAVLAWDPRRSRGTRCVGSSAGTGASHPDRNDSDAPLLLLKRAVRREAGGWWLLADNPFAPGDSRQFGAVPDQAVIARVLFRIRPRRSPAPLPDAEPGRRPH